MTITARIYWQGADGLVAELEFAFPLSVGSTFVVRTDCDSLVCTVDTIMHYPTNSGSGDVPTVGYFVSKTPLKTMKNPWWMAKEAIKEEVKGLLKLK
jgi:hypothetical protein